MSLPAGSWVVSLGNDALTIVHVGLCFWQVRHPLREQSHHRALQSCRYVSYVCVSQWLSNEIVFRALSGGVVGVLVYSLHAMWFSDRDLSCKFKDL